MKRTTKLQILYGIAIISLMLFQLWSLTGDKASYNDYLETRISTMKDDLSADGFTNDQILTISRAIRDTTSMLEYHITLKMIVFSFINILGLIIVMSFTTHLLNDREKQK